MTEKWISQSRAFVHGWYEAVLLIIKRKPLLTLISVYFYQLREQQYVRISTSTVSEIRTREAQTTKKIPEIFCFSSIRFLL